MSLLFTSNTTLSEIVKLVEELPEKKQAAMLRQLKLKKALALAKKIDAAKKPKFVISDQDIADIVHEHRKATWKK
jgi:hypothetical protein